MAKTKAKPVQKPARRTMVPPTNVIKLMDEIGGTRTAAKLGVSTTLLYKAKQENSINQVVEMAAAGALATLGRPAPVSGQHAPAAAPRGGEVAFFVTVPSDKVDTFQRMVSAIGAVAVSA